MVEGSDLGEEHEEYELKGDCALSAPAWLWLWPGQRSKQFFKLL